MKSYYKWRSKYMCGKSTLPCEHEHLQHDERWSWVERRWLLWLGTKMLRENTNHHYIYMEFDEDS